MSHLTYKTCPVCKQIPDMYHLNFMETPEHIPEIYLPLHGWDGVRLSNGYQKFTLTCQKCQTHYLGEIDVESFVWDFDVTRLAGRSKNYTGYYS